ncbi:STAS domain-containing protein [Phaeacidiphilus oryzae]|uniref:STAS domain-containing protein n=1 Tax=Phaeacidiphilus oryzae TaxID=348818 RepID=UPI000689D9EC|nr:STAS domain-containing protein [Phaeacidiphilus oryzae]
MIQNDPMPPDSSPLYRVRRYQVGDFTVLELHGEIDLVAVLALLPQVDEVTAAPEPRLIIDLTHVDFLDASSARLLDHACRRVWQRRGTIRLVRPPGFIRRVLDLTGVTLCLLTAESMSATVREVLPPAGRPSAAS